MALTGAAKEQFEAVAGQYIEASTGQMAWILEWFKEDLPVDNKGGDALVNYTQDVLNHMYAPTPVKAEYIQSEAAFSAPTFPPVPPPKKQSVLVFGDKAGWCKAIMENAPEGRVGVKKIVDWRDYSLEDASGNENLQIVGEVIGTKGWDLIIFGAPLDIPKSNHVDDIIDIQTRTTKLALAIVKYIITTENPTAKIAVLTRGAWSENAELHKTVGLSLVASSLYYGFVNTARQELENTRIMQIDTEYFMKPPFWDTNDYQLIPRLASEVFNDATFGANNVMILNSGRWVSRHVRCTPYAEAVEADFPMPEPGDIIGIGGGNGALGLIKGKWLLEKAQALGIGGFKIQFLSRSTKISDVNMPTWKEVEKLGAKLDVEVAQEKMDLASQEAADKYVESTNGRLFGFIHSAGVLADSMIMNVTWKNFETVWNPKHRAALWLHSAFERIPNKLQFWWNFSSMAVYGNMGQLNYSASNSFLDGLVRYRRAMGLPAQTFQWGAWGEAGMASTLDAASKRRMEQSPFPPFSNKEGLSGMEEGLRTGCPTICVMKSNPMNVMGMMMSPQVDDYTRNFYSELYPTPTLPCEVNNAYNILRMAGFPYVGNPNREPQVWNTYTAKHVDQDYGDEYDEQAPGISCRALSA